MKKLGSLLLLAALVMVAVPAHALQGIGVHAKVVDGILFLVDQSGSMYQKHAATGVEKIEMAKKAMVRLNAAIPQLGYQGGVCALSPNAAVVAPGAWDAAQVQEKVYAIRNNGNIYGRMTPLGKSFTAAGKVISQLPAKNAVVLFSDGQENLGPDAVASLNALYAANPGMVMHFVSLADHKDGQATLKKLAALKPGSLLVDGRAIIDTDEAVEKFVTTAFYNETLPSTRVVGTHPIFFQTAKYNISKASAARLDALADVLKTRRDLKIYLEGSADVRGGVKYNVTLSDNRANAVKQYLVNKGCDASRIIIRGVGKSSEYPSLQSNRRVDIMVVWK